MSCQQVSRLIPTTTTSVSPEDPYVFTETVPTTPPTLFNTQKTRTRIVSDKIQAITELNKPPSSLRVKANAKIKTDLKLPLTPLNANNSKAQASQACNIPVNSGVIETPPCKKTASYETALKSTTQSHQQEQKLSTQDHVKKAPNVCIVRPQQQKLQQPRYQTPKKQNKSQNQKQSSPPPLLPPSPSLWQTPLLLDTSSTIVSPPTSPASLPSPTQKVPVTLPTDVTATATPLTGTTAASTLPPSKFHHTTLAQHLQKVQCIKKPKKITNDQTPPQQQQQKQQNDVGVEILMVRSSPDTLNVAPPPLQAIDSAQHSDSDLNDIPVNVIFRKPQANEATLLKINRTVESPTSVDNTVDGGNAKIGEEVLKKSNKTNLKTVSIAQQNAQRICAVKGATAVTPLNSSSESELKQYNLSPPPSVLRDIVFVHRNNEALYNNSSLLSHAKSVNGKQETSSMAKCMSTKDLILTCNSAPKHTNVNQCDPEKCSKKVDTLKSDIAIKQTTAKNSYKRKMPAAPSMVTKTNKASRKKNRKLSVIFADQQSPLDNSPPCDANKDGVRGNSRAVAVMKMSVKEVEADATLLASHSVLPYCIQKHWFNEFAEWRGSMAFVKKTVNNYVFTAPVSREERILRYKKLLHRQAMQLSATHSLQKFPLQLAKRRLMCVDRLLRKYRNHNIDGSNCVKRCEFSGCTSRVMEMSSYCQEHIVNNAAQHIFLPCTAKFADNTQCRIPIFDIMHDLPLCTEHARKCEAYNRALSESRPCKATLISRESFNYNGRVSLVQLQQFQTSLPLHQVIQQSIQNEKGPKCKKVSNTKVGPGRKRKATGTNGLARPQKRSKKVGVAKPNATSGFTTGSAVLQRKSSTTSLESITSNSQSSNSQPHYVSSLSPVSSLVMPALAPLSGGNSICSIGGNKNTVSNTSHQLLHFGNTSALQDEVDHLKAQEINQIVAQFPLISNNRNNEFIGNSYGSNHNMNFICTNSDSNFTSGLGSTSSLPSTEELLRHELLSACENSSAYASSEDTGLGGLSETELMAGAPDADDIPLGDTRLLEEHDLANVLSALPEDAFSELFTAVHQDERDEVERALELADKHLKSLQQTIGSSMDFLSDFPDDEILADNDICNKMDITSSMMHSPDTSGIDTSTLFIDGGSNNAIDVGAVSSGCPVDIRGLVQT